MTRVRGVEVIHWNPRIVPVINRPTNLPLGRPVNNFGDLLGPAMVRHIVGRRPRTRSRRRLVSVGSILQLARDGDVIWGTGVNGKSLDKRLPFSEVDIRAVRGPLTRERLLESGLFVPEVYGDPGVLVGRIWERARVAEGSREREVTIIPNLHDLQSFSADDVRVVNPTSTLRTVLAAIASSSLVIGSSLHAVVVAESFGIPARLVRSSAEPQFKYRDYYLGTGRSAVPEFAGSVSEALEMGGVEEPPLIHPQLLSSFPFDLWEPVRTEPAGVASF